MTKFGLIRFGKGEIFWRKTQRNETEAQLCDLERQRLQVYPWRVSELQKRIEDILCLHMFSLNVFKFDLYLLKQCIFKSLNRDFEQAYLMIVGQSSYFTSCYCRFNFCTAIFYRRKWSMNSKEWLQHFMHEKFFFAKCSQSWFAWNKKGHFASFLERPLNEVRVKRVCKSCIREHSEQRVLDHNRNLGKSDLRN